MQRHVSSIRKEQPMGLHRRVRLGSLYTVYSRILRRMHLSRTLANASATFDKDVLGCMGSLMHARLRREGLGRYRKMITDTDVF